MVATVTLGQLATTLALQHTGDAEITLTGIAPLKTATQSEISFLDNAKYRQFLPSTQAGAVILAASEVAYCPTAALIADDPYYVYAKVAGFFQKNKSLQPGIHASAVIAEGCEIPSSCVIGAHVVIGKGACLGEDVIIEPGCVIGEDVQIGAYSRLGPHVVLHDDVIIGKRALIHASSVIGSDGFGNAKYKGQWHKVPQLGRVIIGDDVEIGAHVTIDRGALEDTCIHDSVKIDNQVHIAHNVVIGERTAIAGCVGIAGSAHVGKDCLLGGGVGLVGHISLCDNVAVTAMSGVGKSIQKPGVYSGYPARPNQDWKRAIVSLYKLDKVLKQFNRLQKQVQRWMGRDHD